MLMVNVKSIEFVTLYFKFVIPNLVYLVFNIAIILNYSILELTLVR